MKSSRVAVALVLFGVTFAYVEAAVVVYLRTIYGPIHQNTFTETQHDELFPLLQLDQLQSAGPKYLQLLYTELGRELATMGMLAAVALAMAANFRQWLAAFMIAFGVWDIFYYVFLKILIGWPDSLWTWDILFLLPAPWVGPVIAPVLVAASMVVAGVMILRREALQRPIRFRWSHWRAILGGGLIIIMAFCWDYHNTSTGGWPNPFNWPLFLLGETIGLAGFAFAYRHKAATSNRAPK